MGGIYSKLFPQGVAPFDLVTRWGKFVVLGAGMYSADWFSDLLALESYAQSKLWVFCAMGSSILIVNPSLVWLYMVKQEAAEKSLSSYLSYLIPVHVWSEAINAVKEGEATFQMAFITVAEAPAESFPQSLLQSYSLIIGVFDDVADETTLGVPTKLVIQMSILMSFATMAKSMTTFDFYGQEDTSLRSKLIFALQALHRLAQVVVRVLSIAFFGGLMRPQDIDIHQNCNYWPPCLLLFGFLSNLALIRWMIPEVELPFLWAIFSMLGSPPLFLAVFDPIRTPLACLRGLELVFMLVMVGIFVDAPVTSFLEFGVLACTLIAGAGLLVLTTLSVMVTQANIMHPQYVPLQRNSAQQSDALIKASKAGDAFLVRILAKLASCNAPNADDETPVSAASAPEITKILVSTGKVDWTKNQHKQKILDVVAGDDVDWAKLVVTSAGINVNDPLNSEGETAVSAAKSASMIELLAHSDIDWNTSQHKQKILDVVADNNVDIAKLVVTSARFNVNEPLKSDGETAVSAANSAEMMTMLILTGKVDWNLPQHKQKILAVMADNEFGIDWNTSHCFQLAQKFGILCISGSGDNTIKLWDLASGGCLKTLKGHTEEVWALAALGTDKCISGSKDKTIKFWDLAAGTCLKTLEGHTDWVLALAALGTDKCISGSKDRTIKLWDLASGTCLKTLKGHTDWVWALAALGTDKCISGSGDKTIKFWGLAAGTCLKTLEGHTGSVYALAALGTDKCISGSGDKTTKFWDLASGTCLKTLKGHTDWVYALAALGTDKCISGSRDETIKFWDLASGTCLKTLEGHSQVVRAVAVLGMHS